MISLITSSTMDPSMIRMLTLYYRFLDLHSTGIGDLCALNYVFIIITGSIPSAGGLLVPECIICPVVSAPELSWLIRHIFIGNNSS